MMPTRKIDLTFPIHEGMTTFAAHWHPFVEVTQLGRHGIENRETRKLVLGTHTGTHCDAPRHFIPGGSTVDQIPLDVLIGPAAVVDLSSIAPRSAVSARELDARVGGRTIERVVLRYDWSDRWGTSAYYRDHPFLTEEAGEWLLEAGVKLVAMDTPMPDNPANGYGSALDSPLHKLLLGRGVVLVEYLCNLREIRARDIELLVLPLKIVDGDGAPARCVAIEQTA
jgi:kynurenine formamidase